MRSGNQQDIVGVRVALEVGLHGIDGDRLNDGCTLRFEHCGDLIGWHGSGGVEPERNDRRPDLCE